MWDQIIKGAIASIPPKTKDEFINLLKSYLVEKKELLEIQREQLRISTDILEELKILNRFEN